MASVATVSLRSLYGMVRQIKPRDVEIGPTTCSRDHAPKEMNTKAARSFQALPNEVLRPHAAERVISLWTNICNLVPPFPTNAPDARFWKEADLVPDQEFVGGLTSTGGGGSNNVFIPSSADLKARTIAEGGDRQPSTPGLIPHIHARLLGVHSSNGRMGERGNPGPGGTRERQSFMRGGGNGLDLCSTKDGARGGRGRGASAEWRLCDQQTVHYSQRGLRGSRFSCGYRNIQMLCSALMERPEYRR